MSNLPNCPICEFEYTYEDGDMYICSECAHEWAKAEAKIYGRLLYGARCGRQPVRRR